jgi:hypothetical protein
MRTRIPLKARSPLLALALLVPVAASAADEHRELGAHVHGHGTLNIAIEDKRVSIELEAPGMDIVGFEHAASTDDQKSKVDAAKSILQRPLDILALPAAAGCSVAAADVALEAEHHHDDDGDGHDHDKADKAADDHDHGHGDHDHAGHNQFHATYELECASPAQLTSIGFDYFKHFTGAQGLTVNVAAAKGQSKYEVSRDKPALDLAGIM